MTQHVYTCSHFSESDTARIGMDSFDKPWTPKEEPPYEQFGARPANLFLPKLYLIYEDTFWSYLCQEIFEK